MTLPATGPISMSMVAAELGISATGLSLNDSSVRNLASKPSGIISMSDLYGKSALIREPASGEYFDSGGFNNTYWDEYILDATTQVRILWQGSNMGVLLNPVPNTQVVYKDPGSQWYYVRGSLRAAPGAYQKYFGIYRQNVAP